MDQQSYPPMSDIKIDSVNETIVSGDSERDLIGQIQPNPIVIAPVAQPKTRLVKKLVKKPSTAKSSGCKGGWGCSGVNKDNAIKETDSKKVKDAKTDVAKFGRRLTCTAKTMICVGALGAAMSVW